MSRECINEVRYPRIVWANHHQRLVETAERQVICEVRTGIDAMGSAAWARTYAEDIIRTVLQEAYLEKLYA
jgi:hypothetical protein